MKKIIIFLIVLLLPLLPQNNNYRGCTVFTLVKGDQVFFGGNDDYINPDSYYWVDQGNSQKYGVIWIGTPDNVQQGVNECGLAYDANGLPRINVNPHHERIPVPGGYNIYPVRIMNECATVEEVIEWINKHEMHSYMHDQMQFADVTGDAVIISAGKDGELVFTRKDPGDGYLVSTNFNVANPANGTGYPCWRYDRAQSILDQLLDKQGRLSEQDVIEVLDAVHVEGGTSWTIESMLADLSNGIIYLYFFHQFDKPVIINVAEELNNPHDAGALSNLFTEEVRKEADRRYQIIQSKAKRCQIIGLIWAGLVILSLILLFPFARKEQNLLKLWLPAVILLGPFALVLMIVIQKANKRNRFRDALLEAIADLTPTTFSYLLILSLLIILPYIQGSWFIQLFLIFIMPILINWLLFMSPLLANISSKSFQKVLKNQFAHAFLVTNLGMAGISLLAFPLLDFSLKTCTLFPFSETTLLTLLVIVVIGSLAGLVLLALFELWAVNRNYRAWSTILYEGTEIRSITWRKHWWLVLISYLIFFVCLAAGSLLK